MKKLLSSKLFSIAVFILVGVAAYFINVEIQSYLGRQALQKTGLQSFALNDALAKAASEDKFVLVDVAAIWCPTCRRLDNEVFANQDVRKTINERFVFSRLEYESPEGTEFLKRHNATGFPNLWVLDKNGNVVKHLSVTFAPQEFIAQLP